MRGIRSAQSRLPPASATSPISTAASARALARAPKRFACSRVISNICSSNAICQHAISEDFWAVLTRPHSLGAGSHPSLCAYTYFAPVQDAVPCVFYLSLNSNCLTASARGALMRYIRTVIRLFSIGAILGVANATLAQAQDDDRRTRLP